jgi:hypothetical protein
VCWNGRRGGLKIRWWQHRVGSSPTTGTSSKALGINVSLGFLFFYVSKKFYKTQPVLHKNANENANKKQCFF